MKTTARTMVVAFFTCDDRLTFFSCSFCAKPNITKCIFVSLTMF